MADSWLVDTRDSYDADADGYAEKVQGLLEASPYLPRAWRCLPNSYAMPAAGPLPISAAVPAT